MTENIIQRISVNVKPNSRETKIDNIDAQGIYHISISAPADKDKANKELLSFLRKKFGMTAIILSGLRSRKKIIGFY